LQQVIGQMRKTPSLTVQAMDRAQSKMIASASF